jgi:ABC-type nitrate/sulfonate/bicarbonate transport system substrate-binding protein
MIRIVRWTALLAAVTLTLTACGSDRGGGGGGTIRIAVSSESLATQLVRLAADMGKFKDEGLDVELITSNGGAQAVTAMLSGNVQFAAAGAPEVITTNAEGRRDVKALARLYSGLSGSVVLSKETAEKLGVKTDTPLEERVKAPDIPIEDRLEDLDGLDIAFASATSSLKSPVISSAESVGATVKPVYMKQENMPAAMSSGAIDALQASPPVSELAVLQAGGVMWIEGPTGQFPAEHTPTSSSTLITTQDEIDKDPDTVRKVAAAITKTAQLVVDDPGEGQRAHAVRRRGPEDLRRGVGGQQGLLHPAAGDRRAVRARHHGPAEGAVHRSGQGPGPEGPDRVRRVQPEGPGPEVVTGPDPQYMVFRQARPWAVTGPARSRRAWRLLPWR